MQLGCGALAEIIHVSAQPVAPSLGITASAFAASGPFVKVRFTGHAVPTTIDPSKNPSISSV